MICEKNGKNRRSGLTVGQLLRLPHFGSEHFAFEAARARQLQHQLIARIQRTNAHRRASEDHITRLQGELRRHVLDHRHDRVEHQRTVAVLAHFAIDDQADTCLLYTSPSPRD